MTFAVAEQQRKQVAEQLIRKDRLAKALEAEKGKLEAMKKEVEALSRPLDPNISPQVYPIQRLSQSFPVEAGGVYNGQSFVLGP